MKRALLLLLPLSLLLMILGFRPKPTNDNIVHRIAQQLQKFYSLYPQEKIHLHQDKTLYSLGETIWFKAYLTRSSAGADTTSTVIYADLISPDNKVIFTRKLQAKTGMAPGDFYLPDTLAEGHYQIRAYTNWMRNFDQDYFFTKNIKIVSSDLNVIKTNITSEVRTSPSGDSIMATIQLYRHASEPVKQSKLRVHVTADGKTVRRGQLETDHEGTARISMFFEKAQLKSLGEATLLVQSDDKKSNFKKAHKLPIGKLNFDLQFFPEGGHLVTGITSKIAFKAIDIAGKGKKVAGIIYDQEGNKVTEFESEHLGMGVLTLTPKSGHIYTAKVKQQNGSMATFKLPSAQKEGVTLSVNRINEQTVDFKIAHNYSASTPKRDMYLVAHAEEKIILAIRVATNKAQVESAIPASRFPAGLIHFTLFDQAGVPLCERLVYVNQPPQLNLNISTDRLTYGKREKVNMVLEAKDQAGNPVAGNFSLAVRDALSEVAADTHAENIYTSLFLSSELKGHVEHPAYYFDKKQPMARHHLDLLLLTQGWRRFAWNDILQDKFPATPHHIEQSIIISGRVDKDYGKRVPQKSNLTLIMRPEGALSADTLQGDRGVHTLLAESNEDGSFHFSGLEQYDSLRVFIQARTLKGSSNQIITRDIFSPPAPLFHSLEHKEAFHEKQQAYSTNMNQWAEAERQYQLATGAIMLKQVDVTAKKIDPYEHQRMHLKELVDVTIDLRKEKAAYGTALEYLQGRVPGLLIRRRTDQKLADPIEKTSPAGALGYVAVSGDASNPEKPSSNDEIEVILRNGKPLFLLDGNRVDLVLISNVLMSEIEFVEVIKGPHAAAYGASGAHGVIAFYTKRFNPNYDWTQEQTPGTISFTLPGYNRAKEFYIPRYDTPNERHNLPDYRNTLHWQHTVTTDASGKAHISFFTSDNITELITTCEGISTGGVVGTTEYRFNKLTQ